jgi:hypothetical protein
MVTTPSFTEGSVLTATQLNALTTYTYSGSSTASKTDVTLGALRIVTGTTAVPLSAAASGTAAVSFGPAFSAVPVVTAVLASNSVTYIAGVGGVTSAGFTAIGFHRAGTASTATLTVSWTAIGPA